LRRQGSAGGRCAELTGRVSWLPAVVRVERMIEMCGICLAVFHVLADLHAAGSGVHRPELAALLSAGLEVPDVQVAWTSRASTG